MKRNRSGYMIEGPKGFLHILFYSERMVRFVYSTDRNVPPSTIAVAAQPRRIEASLQGEALLAGPFRIEVDNRSLAVKIADREGKLLSEDIGVNMAATELVKKRLSEQGIFGNGEKYTFLNQLGTATVNYNSDVLFHHSIHNPLVPDMHTAIPFYIGLCPKFAYGLYFDNSFCTAFDFAKTDPERISFQAAGGTLDYYFIYGPSVAQVIDAYSSLTGRPFLPAKNFLGYHQSRYSYEDAEQLLSVAHNLRKHQIPCDVLYLDIAYMDACRVFTVDEKRFKDFRGVVKKLKTMGFAVVVIVNPGVKVESGYRVYDEGREKGYFVRTPRNEIYLGAVWPGPAAFPDFMRREVRQWWAGLHRELLECGVAGIWNDMNEPTDFTREEGTLPDDAVHLDDAGNSIPHKAVHNLYGLQQNRATLEALEKYRPEKRPFILTRAAFAGSQRFSALWTGDNASTWEHLESSIPMLLNLGLSGYSFVGADVGGYRGDCSGELMVRWTQLGAFIPFFRNHSETGTARQEPYAYSPEIMAMIRKYIRLRYRLLTYHYNLMRESALTGAPPARPLFYHHQDDLNTYNISDQFLLGEGVMVCPVVRPGRDRRLAYFPPGLWHDYWSGQLYEGGRYHICKAPLDLLPLYIKAGTILPHDQIPGNGAAGQSAADLTVHCYAGDHGAYRLYLDDGVSFNYRRGEYSEIEITMTADPLQPEIEFNTIQEGFPLPVINSRIHAASRQA